MSEPRAGRSVLPKPDRVFERDREWAGLTAFASNPVSGALLGAVSGRPLQDWGDAFAVLFGALRDQPRTVVIDEFPFLGPASSC